MPRVTLAAELCLWAIKLLSVGVFSPMVWKNSIPNGLLHMISEDPNKKDLELIAKGEKRRRLFLAVIVGLFFFTITVAILL